MKYHELFDAFKEATGTPKTGRKDDSIGTKPTIPCPDVPESVVLKNCLEWLHKRGIVCDRNNTGLIDVRGGKMLFGIKGAGDIVGCLPSGRHFEIEVKRGRGGSLSSGQQKRKRKIMSNNGVYLIVHSVGELEKLLMSILKRR
ncbi:hypothetical protein LCGC14_0415920 [marine sediment metagenome]|uniref:VRR-NUC domain-containing protein n=1 Tax=marine sediment metagenome TaxID=412755 RepID=A0A0F9VEF7_9ZZZZ